MSEGKTCEVLINKPTFDVNILKPGEPVYIWKGSAKSNINSRHALIINCTPIELRVGWFDSCSDSDESIITVDDVVKERCRVIPVGIGDMRKKDF